jgi:hypothetical protein
VVSDVIGTADYKIGNLKIEYLGESEYIFQKALHRGSVAHTELDYLQTRGRKSLDTIPLRNSVYGWNNVFLFTHLTFWLT